MKTFEIFDTTVYDDINKTLTNGNDIFKQEYIFGSIVLNSLPISFSSDKIDEGGFYHKFKHLASMGKDETGRKYDSYPCQNDINICSNGIDCCDNFLESFKEGKSPRMYCPFRLSRIYWISRIVELYNDKDSRVKYIEIEEKRKGTYITTCKLWFNESKTDYLIILIKKHNKYIYVSSYPVVMRSMRESLKKQYREYKK